MPIKFKSVITIKLLEIQLERNYFTNSPGGNLSDPGYATVIFNNYLPKWK